VNIIVAGRISADDGSVDRADRDRRLREAAINSVAGYLMGKDEDVFNITDAAVREDALVAALTLVRFAAAAIADLAEATSRPQDDVLRTTYYSAFGRRC
jgi:hypothetical protein